MRPRGHRVRRRERTPRVVASVLLLVRICSACGFLLQPDGTLQRGLLPLPPVPQCLCASTSTPPCWPPGSSSWWRRGGVARRRRGPRAAEWPGPCYLGGARPDDDSPGNEIIVENAGDSRCVLSRNKQAIELSTDLKPDLPAERQRIESAGRVVAVTEARGNIPRIDDGIAVSRTTGDLAYKNNNRLPAKQRALTALPEVCTANITHDAQFLIIACDGIWDCMSSQQAVEFVGIYLNGNAGLALICESLLDHCVAHRRGRDNVIVMLVRFKTPGAGQAILPPPPLSPRNLPPAGSHGDQGPPAAATGGSSGSSS